MFLTSDELLELTGYKLASAQRRWLARRGYPFETNASGKPRVLRLYLQQRLCAQHERELGAMPDFDAIR
jgi:hypothetical protein